MCDLGFIARQPNKFIIPKPGLQKGLFESGVKSFDWGVKSFGSDVKLALGQVDRIFFAELMMKRLIDVRRTQ